MLQQTLSTQKPLPHWLPAVHAVPFGTPTHAPPEQILPVPQLVPLVTLPVDAQTEVPVAHDVVPVWHGFPPGLLHGWLGTHVTQLPPEQ